MRKTRFDHALRTAAFAAAVAACVGCGGSTPPPPAAPAGPTEPPPAAAGAVRPSAPKESSDPAAAVKAVLEDVADGRTAEVVEALPPGYRRDVQTFLTARVLPLEPNARRDLAAEVAAFADMLLRKRQFLLASDRVQIEGPAAELFRRSPEPFLRTASTVGRWPGWAARDDAAIGLEGLVAAAIGPLASDPATAGMLRGLRVREVERSEETAAVEVTGFGEGRTVRLDLVRVEGRWVPAVLAERWAAAFGPGGDRPDGAGADVIEPRLAAVSAGLRSATAALGAVETQAEFDAAADSLAERLMAAAATEAAPRAVRPDEFVTVRVRGPLDDAAKDRLLLDLVRVTDAPASGLADAADSEDGTEMTVTVGPVADVGAFAGRLPGLVVESVDAAGRSIVVRPPGASNGP